MSKEGTPPLFGGSANDPAQLLVQYRAVSCSVVQYVGVVSLRVKECVKECKEEMKKDSEQEKHEMKKDMREAKKDSP